MTDPASIASSNRGPVSGTITLPSTCTSIFTVVSISGINTSFLSYSAGYVDQYMSPITYVDPACYPPWSKYPSNIAGREHWQTWYHSPAACPKGWTTAHIYTSDFLRLSLGEATTAALCCPDGWIRVRTSVQLDSAYGCQTLLHPGVSYTLVEVLSSGTAPDVVNRLGSTTIQSLSSTPEYVVAYGIDVWHQSSDLHLFATTTTSSSPSTPTTTNNSSGSSQNTSSSTPTSSGTIVSSPQGLSTGAKIGLGVGIPFGVIFAAIIGFILFRRRHRRNFGQAATPGTRDPANVPEWVSTEGGVKSPIFQTQPDMSQPVQSQNRPDHPELSGTPRSSELVKTSNSSELAGTPDPAELAGNGQRK